MTIKRAFEILKDNMECTSGVIKEAWDTVRLAVEKQIPKKPKIEKARYANIIEFICPICSKLIAIKDGDYLERKSFCDSCGQALDWSDSNGPRIFKNE